MATKNITTKPTVYDYGFASAELTRLTSTIAGAESVGARMKLVACSALASVNVLGDELLKENGFSSIADFGRSMFGYSKTNTYDMLAVAEKFDISENGEILSIPELNGLGWTALLALKSLDDNTIIGLINDHKLTSSSSVRAIKALVAPKPEKQDKAPIEVTTTEKAPKRTKKPVKKSERSENKRTFAPFTVTCRDGFVSFFQDGDETPITFELGNSNSVSSAIKTFSEWLTK